MLTVDENFRLRNLRSARRPPPVPKPEPRMLVPRTLTPELCPADFVAWMGSASRRREPCARK
jgi:hypothetical protein